MANVLRSEFLGSALQSRTATSSKPAQRVQTQALFKKAEKSLKRETSKVAQKAKGAAGKAQKTAKKSAPSPLKKAQKAVSGSSKKTKGWLGGVGGAQGLDKWYGEYLIQSDWCLDASPLSNWLMRRGRLAGPSRALFLPGGLLDPSDVPSYLNGTLAGE